MQSIIKGRVIEATYSVVCERNEDNTIKRKPRIKEESKTSYETLKKENGEDFIIDGEIKTNQPATVYSVRSMYGMFGHDDNINLSADETVAIIKRIYRADLNAEEIYTDKIIIKKEIGKEEAEAELKKLIAEYNQQVIRNDSRLMSYCNIHKLNPAEVDSDELKKIVYDDAKAVTATKTVTPFMLSADLPNYASWSKWHF